MARLSLRVKPNARQDALLGWYGSRLKLCVQAAPEAGKANVAVCRLLASYLKLSLSAVQIIAGAGSPDKLVEIDLDEDELRRRLNAV